MAPYFSPKVKMLLVERFGGPARIVDLIGEWRVRPVTRFGGAVAQPPQKEL